MLDEEGHGAGERMCGVRVWRWRNRAHTARCIPTRGAAAARGRAPTSLRSHTMVSARSLALLALCCLAAAAAAAAAAPHRARRQLDDENTLQPLEADVDGDEQEREKRMLEGATQAKFGIKNAVLGFVFGKINSLIDAKTRYVDTLDKKNIELNKQYGIEAPQGGLASLSGIVGQVIGPKLQLLGPKLQAVTGLLGGASGGSSSGGQGGSGLGSILSLVTSLSGSSSGGAATVGTVETVDSDEDDS